MDIQRKIVSMRVGMYSQLDDDKDLDEQKYAIIVLCDDNTIWERKNGVWENIDTSDIGIIKLKAANK